LDSPERFNGGLMMFKSSFFSQALTKMDEIYKTLEEIDYDKMFYIEETLLATTISKSRDKALDASKYVQLVFDNELTTPMLKEAVVVHFTDKRKRLFNMQALQLL